jgi:hypothetical protein
LITKICLACKKPFDVWPCKSWRKYCGHPCSLGRQGPKKTPFLWLYNKVKYEAKKGQRAFTLTFAQFLKFTEQDCFYCGAEVVWRPHAKRLGRNYNLDRKNNALGYTARNCVTCCGRCNRAKSYHFTFKEWVQIGRVIRTFVKKKR